MTFLGLIPARSGSKRVPDKNMSLVGTRSLIQRAVMSSIQCPEISQTIIVTDSDKYQEHALDFGAISYGLRPAEISREKSSDIEWLRWVLSLIPLAQQDEAHYVILRPTSPFRNADIVSEAIETFRSSNPQRNSVLRSVSRVTEHPFKMWVPTSDGRMSRLYPFSWNQVNLTDMQTSVFPSLFIQNGMIEIGSTHKAMTMPSTSGSDVIFFELNGWRAVDINTFDDLEYANYLARVHEH